LDVFVPAGRRRIATDSYVSGTWNGEMYAESVSVTLVMTMLRAPDHDTSRRYPITEAFELGGLLSHALLNEVDVRDVLEVNL
jgi:hypothetical protein